jgi:organic hydroperoxide reductase OsmC/OhrA
MHAFPHHYRVTARGGPEGDVDVAPENAPALVTAPPPEFDGPGGRWSPEALLTAAVADCFVLSFRAVAAASRLDWSDLDCSVTGTLDRIERRLAFTGFEVHARLRVAAGTDVAAAGRALEKAEHACLVSNSLTAEVRLVPEVVTD